MFHVRSSPALLALACFTATPVMSTSAASAFDSDATNLGSKTVTTTFKVVHA